MSLSCEICRCLPKNRLRRRPVVLRELPQNTLRLGRTAVGVRPSADSFHEIVCRTKRCVLAARETITFREIEQFVIEEHATPANLTLQTKSYGSTLWVQMLDKNGLDQTIATRVSRDLISKIRDFRQTCVNRPLELSSTRATQFVSS